jgi:hypothetical protein
LEKKGLIPKGNDSVAELSDREHQELLMLYNHRGLDIDRTKHDQWTQISAIFLAQAAIVGFYRFSFSPTGLFNKTELISLALDSLMVLGIVLVILHQARLWRLRNFVLRCDKQLTPNSQNFLGC